ncbi:Acyl-CoA dehydrogenase [Thermomonospora echinospora]|uniref:Acyl-CoA dehydrogenase n=1 Tax=Thermomonospora echinospora TaxID=1992 RepID=A0A1H5TYM0_9ACTN|nr:acyl-CoA dehydrogenase family protein [Thermomonospora echinospora]SEF67883.1 Acyl-CoA dehydrogenase [Thermomonospora echinospora]
MRLTPDADAEELRETVRAFLGRHADTEAVFREMADDRGWDPAVWSRFAGELGLAGLDVPEEFGGAGASFREVAVVAEELGRSLVRLPWFATAVLGVGVLLHTDDDAARAELLPALASGETTAALAYREDPRDRDPGRVATTATPDGSGWRLDGTKTLVVEGATADLLLVTARTPEGPGIYAVDAGAPGLVRTPMRAMDPGRQLAGIELSGTLARAVTTPGGAAPILAKVLDRAMAALAAEQLGGAAAALESAVAYARDRIQFGRPIGSFQAIKHRCADMALHVEAARSASAWATAATAEASGELPLAAATAALRCGSAYRYVAAENIQVHGGIGFTWEHPAHLHFRRAATSAVLFGDPAAHRERLLTGLGV